MYVVIKKLCVLLFTFALFIENASFANQPISWDKLPSLDNIHSIEMQHTPGNKPSQTHYVFVKLPDEYDQNEAASYPVLYLLDGDTNFPLMASYYHYLRFMEDVPPMIIVGLSYGSFDWKQGNNRSHDFTVASKQAEHYGGASRFESFLRNSLLPEIKKRYRINESQQILFGQSLGGQFVLYSALYGAAPFYAVIASNPALHRNLNYFKQDAKSRPDRPKIFITSAEFDADRFKTPLLDWHNHWQKKKPEWQYRFEHLPAHNHLSATPESIRLGLKALLEEN